MAEFFLLDPPFSMIMASLFIGSGVRFYLSRIRVMSCKTMSHVLSPKSQEEDAELTKGSQHRTDFSRRAGPFGANRGMPPHPGPLVLTSPPALLNTIASTPCDALMNPNCF
ncbi:protein FAR1-RELATED SEQUENCE 6-like protein [Corchorus olitorius]|uniref:Protein FAR1-RELATED SEQUENCE 6-like protein n=1 Tax=Corchorus olitorius TaxID=93759 RepID=A0A1R3JG65_9ROSI|nr:protein FAR1-RELATED SEQUENCE 6-like protein [Corchorus olitorius]